MPWGIIHLPMIYHLAHGEMIFQPKWRKCHHMFRASIRRTKQLPTYYYLTLLCPKHCGIKIHPPLKPYSCDINDKEDRDWPPTQDSPRMCVPNQFQYPFSVPNPLGQADFTG